MVLITRQDMIDRFGEQELAERSNRNDYAVIDEAVLQRAMDDAQAQASAYLAAVLPRLTHVPPVLVHKVCDIARYCLYDDGVTQIVEDRYKNALVFLREAAKQPHMLGIEAERMAAAGGGAVRPNVPPAWSDLNAS